MPVDNPVNDNPNYVNHCTVNKASSSQGDEFKSRNKTSKKKPKKKSKSSKVVKTFVKTYKSEMTVINEDNVTANIPISNRDDSLSEFDSDNQDVDVVQQLNILFQ